MEIVMWILGPLAGAVIALAGRALIFYRQVRTARREENTADQTAELEDFKRRIAFIEDRRNEHYILIQKDLEQARERADKAHEAHIKHVFSLNEELAEMRAEEKKLREEIEDLNRRLDECEKESKRRRGTSGGHT